MFEGDDNSPQVARDGLVKGLPSPFSPDSMQWSGEEQADWLCH